MRFTVLYHPSPWVRRPLIVLAALLIELPAAIIVGAWLGVAEGLSGLWINVKYAWFSDRWG